MKNINEGQQLSSELEAENSPEKEKIKEITKRSKQFVIISGPSGSGKTMTIEHLVGDWDKTPYTDNSEDMIVIAKK